MNYNDFLHHKLISSIPSGFDGGSFHGDLYDFQKDIDRWACHRGKAAIFTMTGTGKTAMQLIWADKVCKETGKNVLIFAPLAVAKQSVREGEKFDVKVRYCRSSSEMKKGISITNYDMLHAFSPDGLSGIVLDESGIMKAFDGRTRNDIIAFGKDIPYKLACTATPAPNDYMELGNHAEFLGVMSYSEMLASFFTHDGGDTAKWRLKGHAEKKFWEWMASWSLFMVKPSDLGYSDEGFDLPDLNTFEHIVKVSERPKGQFFVQEAGSLQERLAARRSSLTERVTLTTEIVRKMDKPCLIWCNLNAEGEALLKSIPKSVEIKGADSREWKEKTMLDFADGKIEILITKPDIAGFGMNWQVCHETIFVGITDSFEKLFQATKRFHRHGQKYPVNRHIVVSEAEGSVLKNIERKERDFMKMINEMVGLTAATVKKNIKGLIRESIVYNPNTKMRLPEWI
jgi:hypothetical protein